MTNRRIFLASVAAVLVLAAPPAVAAKDDDGGGNSGNGGGNSGGGNSGNGGGNSGGGNSGNGGGNSGSGSGNSGSGNGNSGSGNSGSGNSGSGGPGNSGSGSSGPGNSGSGSSGPGYSGSPRGPDDDEVESRARGPGIRAGAPAADQDAALEAVRHGFAVPFSLVIPVVRQSTPGSILDAKLMRTSTGDYVYSVLVLQAGGRYRTVRVDAKRNRVIDVRQR